VEHEEKREEELHDLYIPNYLPTLPTSFVCCLLSFLCVRREGEREGGCIRRTYVRAPCRWIGGLSMA